MKIIKLDGRFTMSHRYKYALEFGKRESYTLCARTLSTMYGESTQWVVRNDVFYGGRNQLNPNWWFDYKKRRIYLLNESDISILLLKSS